MKYLAILVQIFELFIASIITFGGEYPEGILVPFILFVVLFLVDAFLIFRNVPVQNKIIKIFSYLTGTVLLGTLVWIIYSGHNYFFENWKGMSDIEYKYAILLISLSLLLQVVKIVIIKKLDTFKINDRSRKILKYLFLFPVIAFVVYLVFSTLLFSGLSLFACDNDEYQNFISPNQQHTAQLYRRNCGATTDFSGHLTLDGTEVFSLYRYYDNIEVKWISDERLLVSYAYTYSQDEISIKRDELHGITLEYSYNPQLNKNNLAYELELTRTIDAEVRAINDYKNYQIKILKNGEFMDRPTDGGGQLTGYSKDGQISKIIEKVGLSYGVINYEYYFSNNQLILVKEKEEDFPYISETGGLDQTKLETLFEVQYYFNSGRQISKSYKGNRKSSTELATNELLTKAEQYRKLLIQ